MDSMAVESRKQRFQKQFQAKRDTVNGNWKIMDMWHPYLEQLQSLDAAIPDDAPCLKIVSDGQVGALLEALKAEGILDKLSGAPQVEIKEVIKEVQVESKKTESYMLKEKVIDSMLKLAGMESIEKVGK